MISEGGALPSFGPACNIAISVVVIIIVIRLIISAYNR